MAVQTTEYGVVGSVGVAVIACRPLPRMRAGVNRELVIETGSSPGCRRVTGFASLREAGRYVVRIRDRRELPAMT